MRQRGAIKRPMNDVGGSDQEEEEEKVRLNGSSCLLSAFLWRLYFNCDRNTGRFNLWSVMSCCGSFN